MKFSVKQCAIIRGSEIKKSDIEKLSVLRKKLEDVSRQRDALVLPRSDENNGNDQIILFDDHNERIAQISDYIDKILSKRTEAAMLRCKATWYKFAEKPSSYFHALEAKKYNKKTIHRIENSHGQIVESTDDIMEALNRYYGRLFSKRNDAVDPDYLALLDIPQVKESDKYWLEAEIQLEEIHLAIKSMNKGKCPGTDGLPIKFYINFGCCWILP